MRRRRRIFGSNREEDIVNVITNFFVKIIRPPHSSLVPRPKRSQGRKEKRLRGLMQMQVINFANPISPAQRSQVHEGGNSTGNPPLSTPNTTRYHPYRDTRLFEILDFRTQPRVLHQGFISKRTMIIRFGSIRLIGSFSKLVPVTWAYRTRDFDALVRLFYLSIVWLRTLFPCDAIAVRKRKFYLCTQIGWLGDRSISCQAN